MSDLPPPPPPSGATPPLGAGGPESKNSLGVWALVLGILSIVCCGFFTGIPAIILGLNSKKAQAQGLATNGTLGQVGFITGIIGTALGVLGIILWAGFDQSPSPVGPSPLERKSQTWDRCPSGPGAVGRLSESSSHGLESRVRGGDKRGQDS